MRTFRTAFLLTFLTLLLLLFGHVFGGQYGMTIALGAAVLMNGIAYFFSDKIALKSSGAQPVTREQAPRLYEVMERLCGKANLPMPKLYMIPSQAPNAFATGRNPHHASVAVTQGLLEIMSDDEMEGVIAHELSHVKNYDILTSSIAATVAGAITWLASMGRWAMLFGGFGGRDDEGMGNIFVALLMLIVAPLAAMLLQLGISRQREYQAERLRRENGGPSLRADQRAQETRSLQQAHPDERWSRNVVAVHRGATLGPPRDGEPLQHASAAREAHRDPPKHDLPAVKVATLAAHPRASFWRFVSRSIAAPPPRRPPSTLTDMCIPAGSSWASPAGSRLRSAMPT